MTTAQLKTSNIKFLKILISLSNVFFFLSRFSRLLTSSSRQLTLLDQVRPVYMSASLSCLYDFCVYLTLLSVYQVTGSWSGLWMVKPLIPGSIMPSVTLSVWVVIISHRDSDPQPTGVTLRSSAHHTTPDWTRWSMERWDVGLTMYLSRSLFLSLYTRHGSATMWLWCRVQILISSFVKDLNSFCFSDPYLSD